MVDLCWGKRRVLAILHDLTQRLMCKTSATFGLIVSGFAGGAVEIRLGRADLGVRSSALHRYGLLLQLWGLTLHDLA